MPDLLNMSLQDLGKLKTETLDKLKALEAKQTLTEEEDAEAEALVKQGDDINAMIQSRTRRDARQSRINGLSAVATPQPSAAPVQVSNVRDLVADDPKKGFRNETEFLKAVMVAGMTGVKAEGLNYLQTAGSDEHSGSNDQYGGFTIPEGFQVGPLMVDPELDPITPLVTNVPMSTPTVHLAARVDKDHSTSVTGGLRVYRTSETEDSASSRIKMERVTLSVNGLMGVTYATEELLSDSPISFAALFAQSFGQEVTSKIIDERINGTGVGQFEGVLQTPALISVAKETGQKADTVVYENVVNMWARQWNKGRAIWLANHNVAPALMKLNQTVGTAGVPAWQPSAREGAPSLLLGRPIYFHEAVPALGDAGDLLFIDWSQYLEGNLGGTTFAESIHVRFLNNERAFRVTARNDGRSWWRSALTPKNGDTLSPFVALAERA
jgi:HK97 family phage major capsid protein